MSLNTPPPTQSMTSQFCLLHKSLSSVNTTLPFLDTRWKNIKLIKFMDVSPDLSVQDGNYHKHGIKYTIYFTVLIISQFMS